MLTRVSAAIFVLCLVFLATPSLAVAQTGTANGKYKFIMEDELMKYLEFDARSDERGTATGYLRFTDEARVLFQDVDGTEDVPREEEVEFFMDAELDSMTIEKNRAVITGVVRECSYRSYIGSWIQLVIEDNDGIEVKDQFAWSICRPEQGGWIPQDAEDPNDQGAFMSWWATDSERKDDVGIPSLNLIPGNLKGCKVYPLLSYEFASILEGEGDIQISQ